MRAGRVGPQIPVPHEEGAWMMFKTLSARQLDEAEFEETKRSLSIANLVSAETVQTIRAGAGETQREQKDSYDKSLLIRYGLHGCSECNPCADDFKDALDAPTRDWAVERILEMNVRPLASGSGSTGSSLTANSHQNTPPLTASTLQE